MNVIDLLVRGANGVRKVAAGLTPFGESVWPGVKNDLFVAHESIYELFATFAKGARVLDAGCGAGYGSARLARAGAREVLGVDVDRRSVRYARGRYGDGTVSFRVADLEALELPGHFDLIVSSNVLEHLDSPDAFLSASSRLLEPGGRLVVALPPITSDASRHEHEGIHYHRSNLTVVEWHELFAAAGWQVSVLAHRVAPGAPIPDFRSPRPSRLSTSAFVFESTSLEAIYTLPPVTVIYEMDKE